MGILANISLFDLVINPLNNIFLQTKALIRLIQDFILFHQRWIAVMLILPFSVITDCIIRLQKSVAFFHFFVPALHSEKVDRVIHNSINRKGSDSKKKRSFIEYIFSSIPLIGNAGTYESLNKVLEINVSLQTCVMEPFVTVGQVVDALLPTRLMIPVVPEHFDIPVVDLVNGIGLETSSHIFGLFKDICVSFDIAMADGSVVHCSSTQNSDLFYAIPFSHGTLGLIVSIEVKVVPVEQYVRLEYIPVTTPDEIFRLLRNSCTMACDFVEGLVFSELSAVIMRGTFVNDVESSNLNRVSHWWKPWFYTHVATFVKNGGGTEYIPTLDYYRRHTRSFFWMMQDIIPFGNYWVFRYLLGWTSPPQMKLLKLAMTKSMLSLYDNTRIVQDMIVPLDSLQKTLTYVFKNVNVFPLWLCPVMCFNKPGFIHPATGKNEMYVNIGTYGTVKIGDYHRIECTRAFETFVRRVHGFQMLYADSYQTREEFARMFDRSLYDVLRRKLSKVTKTFPDIFDKAVRSPKKGKN